MAHLRTLKTANLVLGALSALGVLFGLIFVVAGLFGSVEGAGGGLLFVLYGVIAMVLFGGLSYAHVYAGFMVTAGRARNLQSALATMHLANFPLGTLYALYAFWVCWIDPKTTAIFDRPGARRVS